MASMFDEKTILKYLGLPEDHPISPVASPIPFLITHIAQLPPHILMQFGGVTTPKQRTAIPLIRNRRTKYMSNPPPQLSYPLARTQWPSLWDGQEQRSKSEAEDEKEWAERHFLQGKKQYVRNLGNLLGEYEEERSAERIRFSRRQRAQEDFIPEEDDDSDDGDTSTAVQDTFEESKIAFERRIREHFIYGLLEDVDYEAIDWDESLDGEEDREAEARWFDEDGE
ncbi:hypothetical protein BD779DRAFT_396296 [Infundibulicybe gibba]|nr:hypothetical protein BD779DRAFT_396296 [Infundibulicybe gibba]